MAASVTGTPVALTSTSQSVTVPANAKAAVFTWSYYNASGGQGLASATLNGAAPDASAEVTTGSGGSSSSASGIAVFLAPPPGSQVFAHAFDAATTEGPTRTLTFLTADGAAVAVRGTLKAACGSGAGAASVALTGLTAGDLVLGHDQKYGASPANQSGWTSLSTGSNNSEFYRVRSIVAAGASVTASAQGPDYSSMAAGAFYDTGGTPSPALTDVDTDETVLDGQTAVAVTGTNMGADETARSFTLRQGSTSVPQTETGTGTAAAAALTIGIEQSGADIKFGAATLRCTRTADSEFGEIALTVHPPSGQLYVDVATPDPTASSRITAVADISSGDQLQARGEGGGAVPTGLQINADATFLFASGDTPAAFDVRVWDASDSTWGAWATQSIASGGSIISETASAADSVSSTVAYSATIAESASAADSLAATLAAVAAIAETGTIADSINAALAATAAISETGDAQFTPTTGAAISAAIVETATAADSVASVLAAVAALSESGAASDSVSAIASLVAALAEAMSATDSVSWGGAVYSVDIAEAANATNTLTAAASALAALAETGNATDTVSALASLQAALAEAGTALDTLTVTGVYGVSVSETGDITFTVSVDSGILPGTPARSVTVRAANRTITVRAANRTVTVH